MELTEIIHLSNLAREQGLKLKTKRELLKSVSNHNDKTFLGILGPRGVGKTVLLKQVHAKNKESIYISLDTLDRQTDLFALLQNLSRDYGANIFYLDEVHFLEHINRDLKKIFDFLEIRIIFTSSVSLKLLESAHDLSRRIKLLHLLPFSFREFLKFNNLPCPPPLSWSDLIDSKFTIQHAATLPYFKKFLLGGNFPFSLEVKDTMNALNNNLEKVIRSDIPRLKAVTVDELDLIMKTFKFIARSAVSDINPTVIANNLQITRYKALQYIELLENAFIVKQINPRGTNVLKEPKILLRIPYRLLECDYAAAIGGLREDFAVDCLSVAGIDFGYLKSTRGQKTPDFIATIDGQPVIIEVGGSGKTFKQFKGITEQHKKLLLVDSDKATNNKIPLAYLGLL